SIPNTIQVTYPNQENKWTAETFPVHDPSAINIDGEQHDVQLQLPGVTNKSLARKMAYYALKRMRMDRLHSFIGGPKCQGLEAGDMITITHSTPGFSGVIVRVHSANLLPSDEVAISVQEEDDELYDDTVSIVDHVDYTTNLPSPLDTASLPEGVTFSEELYTVKDRTFSRIKGTFQAGSPYMDYAEVWVSRDDVSYDFLTKAANSFTYGPVGDSELWFFKLVPVSVYGIRPDIAVVSAYSYRVTGTVSTPENVASFRGSVAGDTVMLRWDAVEKTDFAGYEIRYGTGGVLDWAAALFFSAYSGESVNLVGVRPGIHRFFIKAKNTRGIYSAVASSLVLTVFDPPTYTQKHSYATDFNAGTHANTEYYDHPTYGRILRVTHAGGLSGIWTSPQYDLGAVLPRRWWTLYDLAYAFANGTWSQVFDGRTWAEVFDGGLTWRQVFGDPAAGRVLMEFFYSQDGSAWLSTKDFHLLASEVSARYVYYTVTIEDGGTDSYAYLKPVTLKGYYWA
ncbi:MAG: phage tail protein, partial [Syntrophobacteraceae bacterium]